MSEFVQDSQIILVNPPDVVDIILKHRDTFHPYAKARAGPFFRIRRTILEVPSMYHATAHEFHPARMLADAASFPRAKNTGNIHLRTRLGEWKKARPEPGFDFGAEELFNKSVQDSLQVAEMHPLLH